MIVGDDPDPPYERPLLSKEFLRGEAGRGDLPLEPAAFYAEHSIELLSGERVVAIDPDGRSIELARGDRLDYAACVLATGSQPARPDLPGIDLDGVELLRRVSDSERIREASSDGAEVLVVGSGFIGCEAAISMATRGASVTLATMESRPQQQRLGPEVGERIAAWLAESDVELLAESELAAIERHGHALVADLKGREQTADLILLALGIERNLELAEMAGIELCGDGIATDERMRTSTDGVLAAGDVAMAMNAGAGRRLQVEHWGEALRHGEIAGAVLAGATDERWDTAPGFWSGLGERTLKQVAWGDGFERVELADGDEGAFAARYIRDGELVGVLTHGADDDYERGRELVEARTTWS